MLNPVDPGRLAPVAERLARLKATTRVTLDRFAWQFGPAGMSGVVKDLGVSGTTALADLNVPVLALVGDDEAADSREQAAEAVAAVVGRHPASQLRRYGAWTGAAAHCQVGGLPGVLGEVFEWLGQQMPSPRG